MNVRQTRLSAPFALALLLLGTACTVLPEYDVNINEIDTEVSVFEDGLTLPLGSTNKVVLSSLLNSAGESIDEFLKADADGVLVLKYEGSTSLAEQLQKLDLSGIASVDGISINQNFNYHLGDINADNFKVPAQNINVSVPFTGVESVDLSIPPIAANLDALNFKAGLDKYKNVISGNADLDLGTKIGTLGYNKEVEKNATLMSWASPFLPYLGDSELEIPKTYLDDVAVPQTTIPVTVPGISLHEDITAIRDIKLNSNAKMVVKLKVTNPFISSGTVVPDIDLDLSGLLNISEAVNGKIDLSDLALSPANSWTAQKTYTITGLATDSYAGTIAIDENVVIDGTILINDPKTTAAALSNTEKMKMEISIEFTDLSIVSAEIDVKSIEYSHSDVVTIGSDTPFTVPDAITDIKEVKLDPTKPINLKIIPSNLDCLKQKDLPYSIELQFPETVEVEGAVDGKLTIAGDMAVDGSVDRDIVIKAFHPVVANGAVSVKADIGIKAEFKAQNLVVATDDLPTTADNDLAFAVSLGGNPAISDITVTIADIVKETEISDQIEFEAEGLDSFGAITITPEGTPALTIACNIPELPGLVIKPGDEGILITMPDILKFDTSNLNPGVTFTAENNTLLIKDAIPSSITLPITSIIVQPVKVGDVAKVITNYAVTGSIVVPSADISHSDVLTISGKEFGIAVTIPELKVQKLDLEKAISFEVDEEYDFGFDLDKDGSVSDMVKNAEVSLKEVFVNLEATFDGLPDMGEEQFDVDMLLTLPDFVVPKEIPIKGKVADNKLNIDPVQIVKLENVQIDKVDGKSRVDGKMKVTGSVSASGKNIDLSTLKPDISVAFSASLGNGDGKIVIDKVSGQFSYDVTENAQVKLDNMPSMLKQEGVCLDIADPQITLTVTTNLGVIMSGDITIVPVVGGEDQTERTIVIPNITMPYSTASAETVTKSFVIGKSVATAPAGYEFLEADVSGLLAHLPEELRVEIKAGVVSTATSVVETSASYTLDIAYGVSAPVAFGKDFRFTTSTEIDMGQVSKFTSFGEFGVKGKAVNDSPINLTVDMVLLDGEGAEIPQSKSSSIVVKGAQTSDIEFYLSPADKSRSIAKARLDITVTAVPDMPLMETSSLQLKDRVAVLPGGLTADPLHLNQ